MKPQRRSATIRVLFAVALFLGALVWFYSARHVIVVGQGGNLLKNGGFEGGGGSIPTDWMFEDQAKGKGTVSVVTSGVGSGKAAVRLAPNKNNGGDRPLAIGQALPASRFRGRRLRVSAWISATGGARGVVGFHAVRKDGQDLQAVQLSRDSGAEVEEDVLEVPSDADLLILFAVAEGTEGTVTFDDISVTEEGSTGGSARSDRPSERAQPPAPAGGANLVQNGGFEAGGKPIPTNWTFEDSAAPKGTVSLITTGVRSGKFALSLAPNRNNGGDRPLGLGQAFPAEPYRSRELRVSSWMAASGGAKGVVGFHALRKDGQAVGGVQLEHGDPALELEEDVLAVPREADLLILFLVAEGTGGAAIFDDVTVSVADGRKVDRLPVIRDAGTPLTGEITVDAATVVRDIPRELYGLNIEWIADGLGIWNRDRKALDANLIRLARDMGVSLLRFPGGTYSDYYHWKEGVGPQESRREIYDMPGEGKHVPRFGTDEALAFAEATGGELLITVNAGTGTPEEAAAWLGYVNGGGTRRVAYWEIGNELYMKGGHHSSKNITVTPREYADRFLRFARAMRAVDSGIKLGAVGGENYGRYANVDYPNWNQEVLSRAGSEMDFFAVHNAYAPVIEFDSGLDASTVYAAMLAAPIRIRENLSKVSSQIDAYAQKRASTIKLAVTEWGPLFHTEPTSKFVDHAKTLGSALFVASTLKAFLEVPRMEIGNAFKLLDYATIGWIGKRQGDYIPNGPYFGLQMFTRHFGARMVRSTVSSPTYDSRPIGVVDAVRGVPYLDVISSTSGDGRTLYVLAINKNFEQPLRTTLRLNGFRPSGQATAWILNGTALDANTGAEVPMPDKIKWARQAQAPHSRFYDGKPGEVAITSAKVTNVAGTFEYTFPPHSVTSLEIPGSVSSVPPRPAIPAP